MDLTAADPTGAWERWRSKTTEIRRKVSDALRAEVVNRGQTRVILGLSGGLDSTVAAYLCVEALGASNVLGVMLPYRTSDAVGLSTAQGIVNTLGITSRRVNISPMVDAYFANFPDASRERRGTRMAWERVAILHDFALHYGGLVLQIVNRSDLALGYGEGPRLPNPAMRPFEGLYKSQIRLLAQDLGVAKPLLERRPSLDMYPGQSDEADIGYPYEVLDPALEWLIDQRGRPEEAVARGIPLAVIERVQERLERKRDGVGPIGLD